MKPWLCHCWIALIAASALPAAETGKPDAIVAADGSGQYKTVRAAVDACPQITHDDGRRWTIFVKAGTYRELVYIQREKRFVRVLGEDAATTKISFDLYNDYLGPDGKILATYRTPTVMLDADDFTFENITLENSAGPKGQALAIRIDGDREKFIRCRFIGWQDTILVNRGRHYFEDCFITGATDFIFGGATAWFERCHIEAAGNGYLTAASTPDFQAHGYVFDHCRITGAKPEVRTFLGRPWRDYAQTVFLNCEMSDVVNPAGWNNWGKPYAEKVANYAEYNNTGQGAATAKRVPWAKQLTSEQAAKYTIANVLGGPDHWDPTKR
jgi:pectinesterase